MWNSHLEERVLPHFPTPGHTPAPTFSPGEQGTHFPHPAASPPSVANFFPGARGVTFYNGSFSSVGRDQVNNYHYSNPLSALQILSQTIGDVGGEHNAEARYPPPRCYEDTRRQVRQYFIERIRQQQGGYIYWLSGYAGVGKSAIAQSICEACEGQDLVASFFFSRNHSKRKSPSALVLTIAYGLAFRILELEEPIRNAIQSNPAILTTSVERQFLALVVEPCRTLAARDGWAGKPRLVVIDGLDECEGASTQKRVLSVIANALEHADSLPLTFLISSRPEPAIKEFFTSKAHLLRYSEFNLKDDLSTTQDIMVYLRDSFARIRRDDNYSHLRFPDPWPTVSVLHELAWKSCGQFIYIATIIKFLEDEYCDPRERLNIILGLIPPNPDEGQMPFSELDMLYRYILSANPNRKRVITILGFALHALHAFCQSPRNIEILLDLSEGQVALALRGMHSVLEITNSDISIHHASFTDFLDNESRSGEFYIDPKYFRSFAVSRSIHYMNKTLPSLISTPMEVLEPSESLIASLWQHWHNSCTLAAEPTPNLGLSLIDLNVDAIYAIVVHGIIHAVKYGGIQQWVSEWRYVVNDVRRVVRSLERHPVRITNPKLVERFRAAGHGFHVSMENASVLNAVLKLLGAAFWIPESYSRREDNENPFKSLVSNCQDQVRRYLPLRAPAGAGSCIHALGDTPTLAPTECSPGVFYVKTTHPAASLIPFLIDVIHSSGFSSEAIRILLDPPTISDSLLGIAGPHPALLPPLLRVVPEVLKYRGRWGPEKVRLRFLQWLKSFPEDHTQEVAALVQPIKEWAESTKGEARESYCQHRYEEICDLLELDPGSLEEEEDWDECSDTDNSGVEYWCL